LLLLLLLADVLPFERDPRARKMEESLIKPFASFSFGLRLAKAKTKGEKGKGKGKGKLHATEASFVSLSKNHRGGIALNSSREEERLRLMK
jgi:hypothetical protein